MLILFKWIAGGKKGQIRKILTGMSTEATFSAKVNFDFEKNTMGESFGPVMVTVAWNNLENY